MVVIPVGRMSWVFELKHRTIYFNPRFPIMSNLCLNRERQRSMCFSRDYLLSITVTPKPKKEIRYPCHTLLTPFLPSAIAIVVSYAIQGADFHI